MDQTTELKEILQDLKSLLNTYKEFGIEKILVSDIKESKSEVSESKKISHSEIVSSQDSLFSPLSAPKQTLEEIREELGECTRCKLHEGRNTIVFGEGSKNADLVFVGEGPGRDEDQQGRPFVGRAGKLLTKIIEAMGLKREDVYICNVVKCRPPNNRNPEPDEVNACEPFLQKQIRSIEPKVIVCLGSVATSLLLKLKTPRMSDLRGTFHNYGNSKLMITYHPAALLRNPNFKKPLWDDMQIVMEELGIKKG